MKKFIGFNLRLPPEMHDELSQSAELNRRSLHAEILTAIESYLDGFRELMSDNETRAKERKRDKKK